MTQSIWFSVINPEVAFHGQTQLKEAEPQNLSASRQQNQAVCVGKGKNELGR